MYYMQTHYSLIFLKLIIFIIKLIINRIKFKIRMQLTKKIYVKKLTSSSINDGFVSNSQAILVLFFSPPESPRFV